MPTSFNAVCCFNSFEPLLSCFHASVTCCHCCCRMIVDEDRDCIDDMNRVMMNMILNIACNEE